MRRLFLLVGDVMSNVIFRCAVVGIVLFGSLVPRSALPAQAAIKLPPPPTTAQQFYTMDIDAGGAAIVRADNLTMSQTYIDFNNPVGANGTMLTVYIWAHTDITGLRVGLVYTTGVDTYTCRSAVSIGAVPTGLQSYSVSLAGVVGDFVAVYGTSGTIEKDLAGAGAAFVAGNSVVEGMESLYAPVANRTFSVYLEGTTEVQTAVFYPDAHAETSSVDGEVGSAFTPSGNWTNQVAQAGDDADDSAQWSELNGIRATDVTDMYRSTKRGIFEFDTGPTLPDDAVITSATFSLYGRQKLDTFAPAVAPDVNVYAATSTSNTSLANGDYDGFGTAAFCDTPITYAGFSVAGYNTFTLNAAGRAAIAKTGITKLGTRSANYDVAEALDPGGHAPIWTSEAYALIEAWTAEKGSPYKPKLTVTYVAATAEPTVDTSAATGVGATYATLQGEILATAANCTERGFEWGTSSTVYTTNWTENGSYPAGSFSYNATGLTKGELYYFRALAVNPSGIGYGDEVLVLTLPDEPTLLTEIETDYTRIAVSWTNGTGSDSTIVRIATGAYPSGPTNGVLGYSGVGTACNVTGLFVDTTYYVRAWSYASENGSTQYSSSYASITVTTDQPSGIWIDNPYIGGTPYKGQTHMHTNLSDGADTPAAQVTKYRTAGFGFVTISDHDVVSPDPGVGGILYLAPSFEISPGLDTHHVGAINVPTVFAGTDQEKIDSIGNAGGSSVIYHPSRAGFEWSNASLNTTIGFNSLEVVNGGLYFAEDEWDFSLTNPYLRKVWGMAGDDNHGGAVNGDWIMVYASANTSAAILQSMKDGNFYAAFGADFSSIGVNGTVITATSAIPVDFEWKTVNGAVLQTDNATTSSNYTANGTETYVRVKLTSGADYAWSNPFFVYDYTSSWPNWSAIDQIIYDPADDDPDNDYLVVAAGDLHTYLEQMGGISLTVKTSDNGSAAVRLVVDNTTDSDITTSNETFKITAGPSGAIITGYTPRAVRNGAYKLLYNLGVRFFFPNSAWWVIPTSLDELVTGNVTYTPSYLWRQIGIYPTEDIAASHRWQQRNLMNGYVYYQDGATYDSIYDRTANWVADPDAFFPKAGDETTWPWQLDPSSTNVTAAAIAYARASLAAGVYADPNLTGGDNLTYGGVSISLNDGGTDDTAPFWGFWPPYQTNNGTEMTNLVFSLANAVADNISGDYPNAKIVCQNYGEASGLTSTPVRDNVMPLIILGDFPEYTPFYTVAERAANYTAYVDSMAYDYLSVWPAWFDRPEFDYATKIAYISTLYNTYGIRHYYSEGSGNWGPNGLDYWAAAQVLWDATQNAAGIKYDFCNRAFGTANVSMNAYYDNPSITKSGMLANFVRLAAAETAAGGDAGVLARIRQLELYMRFAWFTNKNADYYISLGIMSDADLQSFYTFLTQTRYLDLTAYALNEVAVSNELGSRGLVGSANYTAPTASQMADWLDGALDQFLPTVTTGVASSVENTTATVSGNVLDDGSLNLISRGVQYGTAPGVYTANITENSTLLGVFSENMTGLSPGTRYYARAFSSNAEGTVFGAEIDFLTKPAAPINVAATNGSSALNVTVTWNASTGATNYNLWRDAVALGAVGNVTSYADVGAGAPTITAGNATASDGTSDVLVALGMVGGSTSNGTVHTYVVQAVNPTGTSSNSTSDTGWRGIGARTYQWQRSASDNIIAAYANIAGATTANYNDTAGVATPDGRYYRCVINASGAAQQTTTPDRGFMSAIPVVPGAPAISTDNWLMVNGVTMVMALLVLLAVLRFVGSPLVMLLLVIIGIVAIVIVRAFMQQ